MYGNLNKSSRCKSSIFESINHRKLLLQHKLLTYIWDKFVPYMPRPSSTAPTMVLKLSSAKICKFTIDWICSNSKTLPKNEHSILIQKFRNSFSTGKLKKFFPPVSSVLIEEKGQVHGLDRTEGKKQGTCV